jgi:transposase InsO family protein
VGGSILNYEVNTIDDIDYRHDPPPILKPSDISQKVDTDDLITDDDIRIARLRLKASLTDSNGNLRSRRGGKWTMRRKYLHKYVKAKKSLQTIDINLYHAQNGHLNEVYLHRKAIVDKLKLTGVLGVCTDCVYGKAKRKVVNKISTYIRAKTLFGRVFLDLSGPFKICGSNGVRYMFTIVDDMSRKKWTYLLKTKDAATVLLAIQMWYSDHVAPSGSSLEIVRSDNGSEFRNGSVITYLASLGVMREYTSDYTPQQNAVVETAIRDIKRTAIAMLHGAGLKQSHRFLWGEAILMATRVLNDSPHAANPGFKSPNTMCEHAPLPLELRYMFGSRSFATDEQKVLFGDKVHECLFVGYATNQPVDTLKFMKLSNNEIITSRNYEVLDGMMMFNKQMTYFNDVVFFDDDDGEMKSDTDYIDLFLQSTASIDTGRNESDKVTNGGTIEQGIVSEAKDVPSVESIALLEPSPDHGMLYDDLDATIEVIDENDIPTDTNILLLPNGADTTPRVGFDDDLDVTIEDIDEVDEEWVQRRMNVDPLSFLTSTPSSASLGTALLVQKDIIRVFVTKDNVVKIPIHYKDIYSSKEMDKWLEAIDVEYNCLLKKNTWELVDLPPGKPVVGSRWVFDLKYNVDGSVKKYKARLVCQGFSQTYGVDYFETYAPVVTMVTVRLLIALAASHNWPLHQMDVETAFLNAPVTEEIYVRQSQGHITPGMEDKVYRLNNSLYGLKQACHNWYETLHKFFIGIGLTSSSKDKCLYYFKDGDKIAMLVVYVDDIILTGSAFDVIEQIKDKLKRRFVMKDLGFTHQILGMVVQDEMNEDKGNLTQGFIRVHIYEEY